MLIKKVQKIIEEQHMILPNERVIAGVSGGADSVCLLIMLCALRKKMNFSVEIVHVEHGIRGTESKQDAVFVEELAKKLQVSCRIHAVDVPAYAAEKGLGLEEAARLLRYDIFEQAAKERKAKIALAHHMEDNAETILFQMARGSALTGLCGIQPVRKSETGVTYIRPLLWLHRREIEEYLEGLNQTYRIDGTNQELEYSRNYMRNVIIPELNKINEQTVTHINETANHLTEIRSFLDEQMQEHWDRVVTVEEDLILDLVKLKELHVALQKEIVYKAIGIMAGGKKDISLVHVEQVIALSRKQSGKRIVLPNDVVAIKENETIRLLLSHRKSEHISKNMQDVEVTKKTLESLLDSGECITIPFAEKGKTLVISPVGESFSKQEIPQKTYTKCFDYDKIKDGFCIRTRRSGDYLIYDEYGHRKKLKQYFIDEKIPVTKRDETWILAQGNMILWVIGGRMSEHIKVAEKTKAIVEITIKEEA